MPSLPTVEWDEETRVLRYSRHRATFRTFQCAMCAGQISLGQRYIQTIALYPLACIREGIAGHYVHFTTELQRDTTHEGCHLTNEIQCAMLVESIPTGG